MATEKTSKPKAKPKAKPEELTGLAAEWARLKNSAGGAWDYAKANPLATGLSAGLGIGNVAGLFDNDKLLGQLIGAGAGFGLSQIPALGLGTHGMVNMALGGGALGSLFDVLRAKEEEEAMRRAQLQTQYGGY